MASVTAAAQNTVIDISGNNTSDNYVSYEKAISIPANKGVDVKMARYCYFSSYISGMGTLSLYAVRSALRHRTLGLGDGVDSPQTDRSAVTNARVFDLFGRSVSGRSLKPGVYISEGRKFFVR